MQGLWDATPHLEVIHGQQAETPVPFLGFLLCSCPVLPCGCGWRGPAQVTFPLHLSNPKRSSQMKTWGTCMLPGRGVPRGINSFATSLSWTAGMPLDEGMRSSSPSQIHVTPLGLGDTAHPHAVTWRGEGISTVYVS